MNAANPTSSVIPWERKITPKSVAARLGINLLALSRPVEPRDLYDLFGMIMMATIKPDRSGTKPDSVQFKGEFQAVHPTSGEIICEGAVMFVPVMDSALYSALRAAQVVDLKAQLAIALRISLLTAPPDKPSMTGYEFNVQRLIPQERSPANPIEQLKALARQTAQNALAAPKREPVTVMADSDTQSATVTPAATSGSKHGSKKR